MLRARILLLSGAASLALVHATPAAASPNSDAVNAIVAFNPANEDTFERLEQVIDDGRADVFVLRRQLASSSLNRRWAAAYVGHNIADREADYRALRPRLRDRDRSVRALAAFGLLGGGKKEAIPRLIHLLSSREYMRHSEPLAAIPTLADERLTLTTRADFGFDITDRAKRRRAIKQWRRWWREVRRTIRWDRQAKRFRWRRERSSRRRSRRSAVAPRAAAPVATAPVASPSSTTGSVSDETLRIEVPIELRFDSSIPRWARNEIMRNAELAENFLNGQMDGSRRTGQCLALEFDIKVKEGAGTPGFHQLKVDSIQYIGHPALRRSFVMRGDPGNTRFGRLWTGEAIGKQNGPRVIAHEAAHLAGLPDEYTGGGQNGRSRPIDPKSFLGDHVHGEVLQRHLEALAERFARPDQLGCELWTLTFRPWSAQLIAHSLRGLRGRRHFIGFSATANLAANFWVNPRNGRVAPAGRRPCGELLIDKNKQPPCRDLDEGSELTDSSADSGNAPCDRVDLAPHPKRFETKVTGGERREELLRLRLDVGDREFASLSCDPPPETPGGEKKMISGSMRIARSGDGDTALDFAVAASGQVGQVVQKSFSCCDDPNRRASGTTRIARVR